MKIRSFLPPSKAAWQDPKKWSLEQGRSFSSFPYFSCDLPWRTQMEFANSVTTERGGWERKRATTSHLNYCEDHRDHFRPQYVDSKKLLLCYWHLGRHWKLLSSERKADVIKQTITGIKHLCETENVIVLTNAKKLITSRNGNAFLKSLGSSKFQYVKNYFGSLVLFNRELIDLTSVVQVSLDRHIETEYSQNPRNAPFILSFQFKKTKQDFQLHVYNLQPSNYPPDVAVHVQSFTTAYAAKQRVIICGEAGCLVEQAQAELNHVTFSDHGITGGNSSFGHDFDTPPKETTDYSDTPQKTVFNMLKTQSLIPVPEREKSRFLMLYHEIMPAPSEQQLNNFYAYLTMSEPSSTIINHRVFLNQLRIQIIPAKDFKGRQGFYLFVLDLKTASLEKAVQQRMLSWPEYNAAHAVKDHHKNLRHGLLITADSPQALDLALQDIFGKLKAVVHELQVAIFRQFYHAWHSGSTPLFSIRHWVDTHLARIESATDKFHAIAQECRKSSVMQTLWELTEHHGFHTEFHENRELFWKIMLLALAESHILGRARSLDGKSRHYSAAALEQELEIYKNSHDGAYPPIPEQTEEPAKSRRGDRILQALRS